MSLLSKFPGVYSAAVVAAIASLWSATNAAAMDPSTVTAERLYGEIAKSGIEAKPNFIFSPLSIFSVFHSAQKGASGETRKQMDALVGPDESFGLPELMQPPKKEDAVTVDVANRLYVHPELRKNKHFLKFKKALKSEKQSAETIDFARSVDAAKKINSFVANATRNHITDLISPSSLSEQTRLVLINALYFKAPWLSQFSESETSKDVFFTPSGPKEVSFMKGKLDKAPLLVTLKKEVAAVGLPYMDPRLRLYVFMPENLASFEAEMVSKPELIESIITDMEVPSMDRSFEEEMHLSLPKFKLSAGQNKLDLIELFHALGATDMFSMEKADFTGITGDRDLVVSSFVHQADINVDEQGTEATAASGMVMMLRSMPMPKTPIHVVINKPFIFQLRFIHGDTNLILFSGRVADPAAAQ